MSKQITVEWDNDPLLSADGFDIMQGGTVIGSGHVTNGRVKYALDERVNLTARQRGEVDVQARRLVNTAFA